MPRKEPYFVWRLDNGRKYTVVGYSTRGVAKAFMRDNNLPKGCQIRVKPRGRGEWEEYTVVSKPS